MCNIPQIDFLSFFLFKQKHLSEAQSIVIYAVPVFRELQQQWILPNCAACCSSSKLFQKWNLMGETAQSFSSRVALVREGNVHCSQKSVCVRQKLLFTPRNGLKKSCVVRPFSSSTQNQNWIKSDCRLQHWKTCKRNCGSRHWRSKNFNCNFNGRPASANF